MTFFGTIQGVEEQIVLPMVPEVDRREKLDWEKELIGFMFLTIRFPLHGIHDGSRHPFFCPVKGSIP
jgi:hypothetical protein